MSKIDLGFLNRKQLNRLIKAVVESDVVMFELHVLKAGNRASAVLVFMTDRDKHRFDTKSTHLVQDLKRLGDKE